MPMLHLLMTCCLVCLVGCESGGEPPVPELSVEEQPVPAINASASLASAATPGAASATSEPGSRRKVSEVLTCRVAAASDLKFAMDDLMTKFQSIHPEIEVTASYGSSGNLYAQLTSKAPFDLYFSADAEYPRRLIEQGDAQRDSEFSYAIGQVVVWVRNDSELDLESSGIHSLLAPGVRKIAIANPRHAPYGRAAEAALKNLGLYDKVSDRLVFGENVAQTAQFVESGAADIGLIAHSLASAPSMKSRGRYWTLPRDSHPPLIQRGVILSWAAHPNATAAFRDFVLDEAGQSVLKQHGFLLPGE